MYAIGVPREYKNLFERRTAVVPSVAAQLIKQGIPVYVQRSNKRVFNEQAYVDAGAKVVDKLTDAGLIVGVKEPPLETIEPKVYMFFSHTIKGQPYNMPLLQRFMDKGATLIDYELIKDEQGNRLIAFGRFAGVAGMNDALWALGQKLEARGITGPLCLFRPTTTHRDLVDLFGHLNRLSKRLAGENLAGIDGPLIVGIAGYGRVGRGSEEVMRALGARQIKPEEVDQVKDSGLFYTMFEERHMFRRNSDNGFELQEYYEHPEIYHSVFERYLSRLTVLMNSIYWEPKYPRLVTRRFIRDAFGRPDFKLQVIGDTSCDPMGACELTIHCTGPGNPAFTYLPDADAFASSIIADGITIFAVENLPAEAAADSSTAFSTRLLPYLVKVAAADFDKPFDELDLSPDLKQSVIVLNGELTPHFQYLKQFL